MGLFLNSFGYILYLQLTLKIIVICVNFKTVPLTRWQESRFSGRMPNHQNLHKICFYVFIYLYEYLSFFKFLSSGFLHVLFYLGLSHS